MAVEGGAQLSKTLSIALMLKLTKTGTADPR